MKKLLAILLTLIFTFSCFGTLGTTAMAEDEGNILIEKGFESWTSTASEANGTADCVEFKTEGGEEYAALKAGAGSRHIYIKSPTVQVVPGRDYELSLYLRAPGCNLWSTSVAAPLVGVFMPASGDTVPGNGNFYAYKPTREGFVGNWQVEGYDEYQLQGYSFASHSGEGASFKKVMGGNTEFKDAGFATGWKKVTLKFTAMASSTNAGPENVSIAVGFNFKGESLKDYSVEVKDVEFKEFGAPVDATTLFTSDLTKDGNMVAFNGSNKNQDSGYVTFATEENQYIELRSQPAVNGKNTPTAVATAPFNVFPDNEYEISYDLRIPAESASYILSGNSLAPEWWIYQVDKSKMQGHTVGTRGTISNAYAYGARRNSFKVEYSYKFTETGEEIELSKNSRSSYSFLNYQESNKAFTTSRDAKELFAGKWVTVTLKFTGLASTTNSGAELCALSLSSCSDAYHENAIFQIKNVQVKETGFGKTTPVYDEANGYQLSVEDFEYAGTQLSDVAKFYGGS
ncbi:MAG: hypothetical protein IJO49_02710, partial [Clostridia bacterium]|nr:hypothetical protein [Clostridia bacterium]